MRISLLCLAATRTLSQPPFLLPPNPTEQATLAAAAFRASAANKRSLLLLSFNGGFWAFLRNYASHANKLNLRYLAWSTDAEGYLRSHALNSTFATTLYLPEWSAAWHTSSAAAKWGEPAYRQLCHMKVAMVWQVLRMGYNVEAYRCRGVIILRGGC